MVASHFPQNLNPFEVYAAKAENERLRAEVESLRTQLAAAQAEAASAPCNQALCGIYTIEDL